MKKIISLIIISIIIKGYINECTLSGTTCSGEVEGVSKCVYDETTSQCLEKYYCNHVPEKTQENCEASIASDEENSKCVYEKVGDEDSCTEKTLCDKVTDPSETNCQGATTLNPKATKCVYDSESCVIKKICDLVPTLEEVECQNSVTLNPSTTRCFL